MLEEKQIRCLLQSTKMALEEAMRRYGKISQRQYWESVREYMGKLDGLCTVLDCDWGWEDMETCSGNIVIKGLKDC